MTIKQFREEFAKIPDEKVITGKFTDDKDSCCVLGHAMRLTSGRPSNYFVSNCNDWFDSNLRKISRRHLKEKSIATINNNETDAFPQPSAKQRSLAALDELIKAGYGDEEVR